MPLHGYPIIIPAIVAEIRDAIDPPIKAFIPNLDKVYAVLEPEIQYLQFEYQ